MPESLAQVFSCEFCKISKNTFVAEHLQGLLLEALTSVYGISRPDEFCKKAVVKKFAEFTGEKQRWNPVFSKILGQDLGLC